MDEGQLGITEELHAELIDYSAPASRAFLDELLARALLFDLGDREAVIQFVRAEFDAAGVPFPDLK